MFFILSKTVSFLAMPITLITLALLLSWWVRKYRQPLFLGGIFLLLLFTNSFLANVLLRHWELAPRMISELPEYKVGIVLGGITSDKEPRDRVHTSGAADRVLHAVHLYREGKINKILLSGGSGKILKDSVVEAVLLKRILLNAMVPEKDILLEDASRNTRENAAFSAEILEEAYPGQRHLLITSAFHMRRALACFDKVGLEVDPFCVDFRSKEYEYTPDVLIIPNSGAIGHWEVVIRELLGMTAYKVAGYI
ncbi:MAG: YdcF family protein [Cyclobacteriaceae bacterium]